MCCLSPPFYLAHRHLIGFKFIGNTALNLVSEGFEVPFGHEEAIGYMFGSEIRDKDGVAASVSSYCVVCKVHISLSGIRWCLQSWSLACIRKGRPQALICRSSMSGEVEIYQYSAVQRLTAEL